MANRRKKSTPKTDAHLGPAVTKSEDASDYITPKQVEYFRGILNNRKKELLAEAEQTLHHIKDNENHADPADQATQEEEFATELRTRNRESRLIRKIDNALLALDKGNYGYCENCGIKIGLARLYARPTATLCIDCKTITERKRC